MIADKKKVPLPEYEASLDSRIARLKTRLKHLEFGLSRKRRNLDNLENFSPKRVIFGKKELCSKKDVVENAEGMDAWKKEFHAVRSRSMALPGRYIAK